ncbi:hypothetical protein KZ483_08080 [Paenibacillus sp. sptzw28]|uniref:hypothetical protein n=1 Tax=Paenibacillus sp. sptzw28 TaxID=715179 RepID=UPI001C6EE198|nr:hypothetical protein [Paenibacillus sp. sptzw28]QYR22877.1 hypothetical protein KZ483_08080 [Paenibacillus sp. sptzw28]
MKKNKLKFGIPLAAGAVLLLVSGFTASAGTSGYEVYKEALKNNAGVKSVTANVSVSVTDNGQDLINAKANLKLDKASEAASGSLQLGGSGTESRTLNVYHQDEKLIVKNSTSNVYYSVQPEDGQGHPRREFKAQAEGKSGPPKELENVIDALVGNLQQQIGLNQASDGSKEISLHLTGSEIPAAANAIGSLMIKHASGTHESHEQPGVQKDEEIARQLLGGEWKPQLPALTQDVRMESVNIDASIGQDNRIKHQTVELAFEGKDAAGKVHDITITLDASFEGYNSTTPDHVDLAGKQVETIAPEAWGGKHSR